MLRQERCCQDVPRSRKDWHSNTATQIESIAFRPYFVQRQVLPGFGSHSVPTEVCVTSLMLAAATDLKIAEGTAMLR